jgi:hypothetical protein
MMLIVKALLALIVSSAWYLGSALITDVAQAHQQKEAYITVLFHQRTGNLEISHRFLIHDAEHVLDSLFAGGNDLTTSKQTRQRFASYVEQRFALRSNQQDKLPLSTVGHEVQGKYFWIYQEAPIPQGHSLSVKHTALQEVWPSQVNHVNVEKDDWVRSARLAKGHHWQHISLLANDDSP